MKQLLILFLVCSLPCLAEPLQTSTEYLEAEKLFKQGRKDEAKQFYLDAANLGDANAHFALGYRYSLPRDERLHHMTMAARGGHPIALNDLLDEFFFRAMVFKYADPEQALAIYHQAKAANPDVQLFEERDRISVLNKCVEAKGFNFSQFSKKYGASINDSAWRWAREISNTSQNPTLVFQLICRGGMTPDDLEQAVADFYRAWKQHKALKFHECEYSSSHYLSGFCSRQGKLFNYFYPVLIKRLSMSVDHRSDLESISASTST